MARKMLLVDETMYKSLISNLKDESEQTALNLAKVEVEKKKKNRRIHVSARNVLYNQELRRLLKLHNNLKNKPVKVQLSNGPRLISLPNSKQTVFKTGEDEQEEIQSVNLEHNLPNPMRETVPLSAPKRPIQKPGAVVTSVNEDNNDEYEEDINAKAKNIYNYVLKNITKFKINENGEIYRDVGRNVIRGSDVLASIKKILIPSDLNVPSPNGWRVLEKRLKEDNVTKNMLEKTDHFVKKPVSSKGRPLKPTYPFKPLEWKD